MDVEIVQHYNKEKTKIHYPVTVPKAVVFSDKENLSEKMARLKSGIEGKMDDAPKDDKTYARKNGDWVETSSSDITQEWVQEQIPEVVDEMGDSGEKVMSQLGVTNAIDTTIGNINALLSTI